jgi:PAS domain S-box-containing protein
MEEENIGADKFTSIDKFISELIGFHEQIKHLKASEVSYKLQAATLQESLNQYQAVLDHLSQKIFLKDKNFRYLFANENYARSLGVSPQQVFGKTDHDFFPFEAAEQKLNEEREVMEKGVPAEQEGSHTREGRVSVERIVKSALKNASGETVGIMGISWDITDQKAREEELEKRSTELSRLLEARTEEWKEIQAKFQSEQAERRRLEEKGKNIEGLYSILFENTGTAVALIEDNKIISRVNGEFEKISGYSRAEVEGAKNWGEILHDGFQEKTGESTGSPDMNFLGPGMRELKVMDKHNKKKTVSMTVARIPDTGRVLVSLADITKYKKTREELNRVMKQFMELMVEMEKGVKDLDG